MTSISIVRLPLFSKRPHGKVWKFDRTLQKLQYLWKNSAHFYNLNLILFLEKFKMADAHGEEGDSHTQLVYVLRRPALCCRLGFEILRCSWLINIFLLLYETYFPPWYLSHIWQNTRKHLYIILWGKIRKMAAETHERGKRFACTSVCVTPACFVRLTEIVVWDVDWCYF